MRVILFLLSLALVVVAIGQYLGPDDLSVCGEGPSLREDCGEADAIIAVSGGDTLARTEEAIMLYKAGWAPKLVFAGAAKDKDGPSNAAVMRETALLAGVPDGDIIIDEDSETTKQNAEETASLLTSSGISSVIVVTSAYHQRRTTLEFERRFDGIKVRSHPVKTDRQWSAWWWLTPGGWYLALGELVRVMLFYVGVTR